MTRDSVKTATEAESRPYQEDKRKNLGGTGNIVLIVPAINLIQGRGAW